MNACLPLCSRCSAIMLARQFKPKGGAAIRNGDLLQRAEAEFDLFITSDHNIRYQQNLAGRSIAILELSTNDINRIQTAASILAEAVANIQPNALQRLEIP